MEFKIIFLLAILALAFYGIGTIWVIELDVFRTWKMLDKPTFDRVRSAHWKKLPYFVFIPVGILFIGSIVLLFVHPDNSPVALIWGAFLSQAVSHLLTGLFWGRWQAKIASNNIGPADPLLDKIIRTHWVRTALVNINGIILFLLTIKSIT
jgi:hypothetical protein